MIDRITEQPFCQTRVISWVALAESYPKTESELIMYREDAGVFLVITEVLRKVCLMTKKSIYMSKD